MDIFQDNKELEDLAIFGIEWGLYTRHDLETPLLPYMFLVHGNEMSAKKLVGEGDPFELANKALEADNSEFDYFVIGSEVNTTNKEGEREDAILIRAFDVALEFGVSLSKRFIAKESGGFEPISNITFMGKPELPIPIREHTFTEEIEEVAVHGLELNDEAGLINFVGTFTGDDAFKVAKAARGYLQGKLNDPEAYNFSGEFSVFFVPNEKILRPFLNFLAQHIQTDLIEGEDGRHWEESTGRKLNVIYSYDQEKIEISKTIQPTNPVASSTSGGSGCAKSIAFLIILGSLLCFI